MCVVSEKCVVLECPNTNDGGIFEGNICSPCASALRGNGTYPSIKRIIKSIIR